MAGLFFDNNERQARVKDLFGSFNDIRQEMSETLADIVDESAELKKDFELLRGQGKIGALQDLDAKAKAQMTDEEYKEYKELFDSLEKTDHDLWTTWSIMMLVDFGYATVMLPLEISSRIGAMMISRGFNQAVQGALAGGEIPATATNLTARGVQATKRARSGALHIPSDAPALARLQRLDRIQKVLGKLTKIGRIVGLVLLAATLLLVGVDVFIQDSQRTELMKAITDLYGLRHVTKQLAMGMKSEAKRITEARIALNDRASKESTLADLVARGSIPANLKTQIMAEYDAKKKAERQDTSPDGGISLPSDKEVCEVLKARDDVHNSWQKEDPDREALQKWLKEE